jgi:hypothetical protein
MTIDGRARARGGAMAITSRAAPVKLIYDDVLHNADGPGFVASTLEATLGIPSSGVYTS